MDAMFWIIPVVFMCVSSTMVVRRVVLLYRQVTLWRRGLRTEGTCLRTWVSHHSGSNGNTSTTVHHVHEFRTRTGEVVRFEEAGGSATVVQGDRVTVSYLPDRPARATAKPHREGREYAIAVAEVAVCTVFFCAAVAFLRATP